MKNSIPTLAVLLGPAAVAALLLSYRSEVNVDSVVGYASVIALVGLVALEYRLTWKRLFAR